MDWRFLAAAVTVAISGTISGCADRPEDIDHRYIPDFAYRDFGCKRLADEHARIAKRMSELEPRLEKAAVLDQVQTGVGVLMMWPTFVLLEGGNGPEGGEYSRLKGEAVTIERVSETKSCPPLPPLPPPARWKPVPPIPLADQP